MVADPVSSLVGLCHRTGSGWPGLSSGVSRDAERVCQWLLSLRGGDFSKVSSYGAIHS